MSWTQNLCRLCGQIAETCHNIYSSDMSKSLENKIKGCLQLQIKLDDLKPKQICNNCLMKLNELSEFVHTAQKTDVKFDTIYYSTYRKLGEEMDIHGDSSKAIMVSNKETCTMVSGLDDTALVSKDTSEVFQSPSGDFFQPPKTTLQSYRSTNQMLNAEQLKSKIRRIQEVFDESSFKPVKSNPDNRYMLVETVRNSIRMSSMNMPGVYSCIHCHRNFSKEDNLKAHIACNHRMKNGKIPTVFIHYKMKQKRRTRGGKIGKQTKRRNVGHMKCPVCPKLFKSKQALKKHGKLHIQWMLKTGPYRRKTVGKKGTAENLTIEEV